MTGPANIEDTVRAVFHAHEPLADPDRLEALGSNARTTVRRSRRTAAIAVGAVLAAVTAAVVGGVGVSRFAAEDRAVLPAAARNPLVPSGMPADLRERALLVLDHFDAETKKGTGIVVAGELLTQVGTWEADVGDNNKWALGARQLKAVEPLPTAAPPPGEIAWANGRRAPTPVVSASQALAEASAPPTDCGVARALVGEGGCKPIEVTGATLTTTQLQTGTGPATVPAWEFTLRGTSVRLKWVAIPSGSLVQVSPLPQPDNDHFVTQVQRSESSSEGRQLTVEFAGSPAASTGPCGNDYRAWAVETSRAVVVLLERLRNPAPPTPGQGCVAMAYRRTASVHLQSPLGTRTILDPQKGEPVPLGHVAVGSS